VVVLDFEKDDEVLPSSSSSHFSTGPDFALPRRSSIAPPSCLLVIRLLLTSILTTGLGWAATGGITQFIIELSSSSSSSESSSLADLESLESHKESALLSLCLAP